MDVAISSSELLGGLTEYRDEPGIGLVERQAGGFARGVHEGSGRVSDLFGAVLRVLSQDGLRTEDRN